MQAIKNFFSNRIVFLIPAAIIEIGIVFSVFRWLGEEVIWIEAVLRILSVLISVTIIRVSKHPSSDMLYIMLIVLFPITGTFIFLFLGADLLISRTFRAIIRTTEEARSFYVQDNKVLAELKEKAPELYGQFHYISKTTIV